MTTGNIAKALERLRAVLAARPQAAMHTDEAAVATWKADMRVTTRHANGVHIGTDMPAVMGGSGDAVSPGWLLRAGLASCLATRIAMEAAAAGIMVTQLEVRASSRSDARGLLGMTGEDGRPVTAAPSNVELEVSARAPGVSAERLRALIETSFRCSPVSAALETPVPVALRINVVND